MLSQRQEAAVNQQSINHVNLTLNTEPIWNYLAVFIKDPAKTSQYWFRRLQVIARKPQGEHPVVDVNHMPMGEFDYHPCPQEHLEIAVRNAIEYEDEWTKRLQTDPSLSESIDTKAAVGVAEYTGSRRITLTELINLVGVRYSQMQEEHQQRKP